MPTDRLPAGSLALLLLALLPAVAAGAATAPSLEVVVTELDLQVGDRLPVRVMARGGEDLLWGELRVVVDASRAWAVVDGPHALTGSEPPVWELIIVPLLVGPQPLPDLSATVRSATGAAREVAATVKLSVTIHSVLPALLDEEVAPAPMRDPIGAAGLPWEWLVPGVLACLPLVTMLGWWQWRRRRNEIAGGEPGLPPFEELKTLLETVRAGIGHESAETICDRIAAGVRRFLERRTGEPAQEMTSFELRRTGMRRSWPEIVQRSLQQVMVVADRVRFARRPASPAELGAIVAAALVVAREIEAHLSPAAPGKPTHLPEAGS